MSQSQTHTTHITDQSWGLRPWSYDKTGLGLGLAALVLVLVLVLYFWSCFQHCCARQGTVWNDKSEM